VKNRLRHIPLRHIPANETEQQLFELMYERAMTGLDDERQAEYERRAAQHPDLDVDCYERAAAAIWLHHSDGQCQTMPQALKSRIAASALTRPERLTARPSVSAWVWSGWAAAAGLAAWLLLSAPQPSKTLDASAQRAAFLEAEPTARRAAWASTEDPDGRAVAGDVVWSPDSQQGYMRFTGLPQNDPKAKQYQLWIFDAQRPDATPVDGGVFDITTNAEMVVPIQAKLAVGQATMFAVTVEAPGGVVVSKREHIVALASL